MHLQHQNALPATSLADSAAVSTALHAPTRQPLPLDMALPRMLSLASVAASRPIHMDWHGYRRVAMASCNRVMWHCVTRSQACSLKVASSLRPRLKGTAERDCDLCANLMARSPNRMPSSGPRLMVVRARRLAGAWQVRALMRRWLPLPARAVYTAACACGRRHISTHALCQASHSMSTALLGASPVCGRVAPLCGAGCPCPPVPCTWQPAHAGACMHHVKPAQ